MQQLNVKNLSSKIMMKDRCLSSNGIKVLTLSGYEIHLSHAVKIIFTAMVVLFSFVGNAQTLSQKGTDIDGQAAGDRAGYSVSMPDANTVAIGAIYNSSARGDVRIFEWNGSAWVQKGVDIVGETINSYSGYSVSMPDINTVAIGAYFNAGNGSGSGHVRIYKWNGSAWVQKGTDIDGEAAGDNSGWFVSMPDANTVAIGAINNDGNGSNAGHVRIYEWNGSAWVRKGADIDGEAAADNSGTSTSMPDANTVAIGAPNNDGSGSNAGHVRVYEWNGSAWVQKGADINGEAASDFSGTSVSMPDANTVAIGANGNDGNGSSSGHVRIYKWNGSTWVQKGTDLNGEAAGDNSGFSVSMPDANTVGIGAITNDGSGSNAGHVRVYEWNGSAWVQNVADINGEAANDQSGNSVSMPDANTVAIGARQNGGNGLNAGHLRVYDIIPPCATWTWTGATNTDWFTAGNWSCTSVPNHCTVNVIIPAGTPSPVISGASVNVGNINIASGATLTLQAQNLNVCGSWTGGGGNNAVVASVSSGAVKMIGTLAQTISGNTKFDILQINNSNGVSLSNTGTNVSINNGLHLEQGILNVNGQTLRLLSTAANHNSYIDNFSFGVTPGTISGTVLIDRFIPKPGRNQHFISSPIFDTPLSQIGASGPNNSYVTPTADCSKLQSAQGSPYGSTFVYDDVRTPASTCAMANWRVQSSGNIVNAKGYSAYLTGNSILTVSGTPNTGNIDVTCVSSSNTYVNIAPLNEPIESGWNLVGNPYPSTIVLNSVTNNHAGFDNQVQVWKTSGPFSGSWQQLDMSVGATIAPFQAFMVHRNSAGPATFHFYQNERTRAANIDFYRTDSENSLALEVDYNGIKDATKIEFNSNATTGFDSEYDANKPGGEVNRPTLYTHLNANMWYSTNTLPSLQQAIALPMGLASTFGGTLSIEARGLSTFDPTTYIFLEDKKTGVWHNLRNGAYTFTKTSTENQDRFLLHFTPAAKILVTDANCSSSGMINIEQPGSANWDYVLNDQAGLSLSSGTLNSSSPIAVSVNKGIYTLTLTDGQGYVVMKNIEVNGIQPVVANFTSSVVATEINQFIDFIAITPTASIYHWDFGDGSFASAAVVNHYYAAEGIYTVKLSVNGNEGCASSTTQTITITSRSVTGIKNIQNEKTLPIWRSGNEIFVDFSKESKVNAEIELYNIIGQLISHEKFGSSTVYSKEVPNVEGSCVIIKVNNGQKISTSKVLF